MADRDKHGRDANQMTQHYETVPLFGGQTLGFSSPEDISLLVRTARRAALVMAYLDAFGPGVVPHLMDDDENPGERLREDLRVLGLWESE